MTSILAAAVIYIEFVDVMCRFMRSATEGEGD